MHGSSVQCKAGCNEDKLYNSLNQPCPTHGPTLKMCVDLGQVKFSLLCMNKMKAPCPYFDYNKFDILMQ